MDDTKKLLAMLQTHSVNCKEICKKKQKENVSNRTSKSFFVSCIFFKGTRQRPTGESQMAEQRPERVLMSLFIKKKYYVSISSTLYHITLICNTAKKIIHFISGFNVSHLYPIKKKTILLQGTVK